jgi:hypothetical protein
MIEEAKKSGHQIISIPENLKERIKGEQDFLGKPIVDINQFVKNYNDSFKFEFVDIKELNEDEKSVFKLTDDIINLINGKPNTVKEIKISKTMRKNLFSQNETHGLWDPSTGTITILRDMLRSIKDYSSTLIHEILHARSGSGDIEREFENELTTAIGEICEKTLTKKKKWWQ